MYSADDIRTIALMAANLADYDRLDSTDPNLSSANRYERQIKDIAVTAADLFDAVRHAVSKVR